MMLTIKKDDEKVEQRMNEFNDSIPGSIEITAEVLIRLLKFNIFQIGSIFGFSFK